MSSALEFARDPGGVFGGKSSRKATEAQLELGELGTAERIRQFDIGQERLEPFSKEAVPAFQLQAALSGARGPEAQAEAFRQFKESPGVAARTKRGLRLIDENVKGERLKELTRFSEGLALQDLSNQFNRLGVVSGAGQTAATQQAELGSDFARRATESSRQQGVTIQAGAQAQQQARANLAGTGAGIAGALIGDRRNQARTEDSL